MKRGRAGTLTHDYKRHGTTTLFAALNTLDGRVISMCQPRHGHSERQISAAHDLYVAHHNIDPSRQTGPLARPTSWPGVRRRRPRSPAPRDKYQNRVVRCTSALLP